MKQKPASFETALEAFRFFADDKDKIHVPDIVQHMLFNICLGLRDLTIEIRKMSADIEKLKTREPGIAPSKSKRRP